MRIADELLARYAARVATRRAVCQAALTARMPALLAEFLPAGRWLLVADANTWSAQGRRLADALTAARVPFDSLLLAPPAGQGDLVCGAELIEQAADRLDGGTFAAVVAVGSGTVCDTCKVSAAGAGLPLAAVATAPSMNGYASSIAAVLRDGVKRTEATVAPRLVAADLDVLSAAPERMIAAGLADLLAKPVATADWTLAHGLLGDELSEEVMGIVTRSSGLADRIAPALRRRESAAVARLFEALFVSGLSMAVAGASRPISGGEHLISHYLDMTALAGGPAGGHDLHGLQVGVATLTTASLYRRLLAWEPGTLDIAARVAGQPAWARTASALRDHFGPVLAPAVLAEARGLWAEGDALADRLNRFCRRFGELKGQLAHRLAGAERLERELADCGAATRFSRIGVDRDRAVAAVTFAHHVRARYTILHLLADLGLLDDWARAAADELA